MLNPAGSTLLDGEFDLATLVEHNETVQANRSMEDVYGSFRTHAHAFVAVVDDRRYVGVVSRGHVGFLLGARFGFALYAKQPVVAHLLTESLAVARDSGLMSVLSKALARTGDSFYDDVALLDEAGAYLGMIPVRKLIALQSDIIAEQSSRAAAQQAELAEKNQQLFRSLNELRQSQGRYESLLKNSALGIALLNNDGGVEVCNPRTEALIGFMGEGDGCSRNMGDWIVPSQRAPFLELLRQHEAEADGSLSCEREFTLLTANRGERLFRFFTTWIVETGQVCVQLHDVTDQRNLESRMALNEKSVLFESLVGGIAHELNNKLSPVLGFAELLHDELAEAAPAKTATDYCAMIVRSATEAAKLVRQLLQMSRPPAIEMASCDLGELVAECGNVLSYRLRETGTQLHLDKPTRPMAVMADPSQLKQVFLNLMINALDAMEQATARILTIGIREVRNMATVVVSDTGHGIKPEHLNRIFNPFFTTKEPDRGTGLGLCVCLSIIRQHKGEIAVDSTVGVGTRFQIRLPLAVAGCSAAERGQVANGRLCTPPSGLSARLRVMIVDDEQFVTALIQETLRRAMGWQVERVHNGRQAIARLEQETFDMLISDARMPEVDGLALYEWLCEHRPALAARVLFVTGDAGSADLTQALHDLGRPVLYKPFTTDMLIAHCQRLAPA
jgi:signal transduction histidine kinase